MKKIIQIGDVKCTFYKDLTDEELENVHKLISSWSNDEALWTKTSENLANDNRGSTISTKKNILVLLSHQTSKAEMLNTLSHEMRHVVDLLSPEMEVSPAQMTGEIFSHFADWL